MPPPAVPETSLTPKSCTCAGRPRCGGHAGKRPRSHMGRSVLAPELSGWSPLESLRPNSFCFQIGEAGVQATLRLWQFVPGPTFWCLPNLAELCSQSVSCRKQFLRVADLDSTNEDQPFSLLQRRNSRSHLAAFKPVTFFCFP